MNALNIFQKIFRRAVSSSPLLERWVIYRNPRKYWNLRGGDKYFQEQESYETRQKRSEWLSEEIAKLPVNSVLEIGCGYGKQLKNLSSKKKARFFGIDFSHSQLLKAQEFMLEKIPLAEADAARLPFLDNSFELVFSSAVILHNPKKQARQILSEMIRTSRGYLLHNEDKNVSSTRYTYNLPSFYKALGFEILRQEQIPVAANPANTQFLIARFSPSQKSALNPQTLDQAFEQASASI